MTCFANKKKCYLYLLIYFNEEKTYISYLAHVILKNYKVFLYSKIVKCYFVLFFGFKKYNLDKTRIMKLD